MAVVGTGAVWAWRRATARHVLTPEEAEAKRLAAEAENALRDERIRRAQEEDRRRHEAAAMDRAQRAHANDQPPIMEAGVRVDSVTGAAGYTPAQDRPNGEREVGGVEQGRWAPCPTQVLSPPARHGGVEEVEEWDLGVSRSPHPVPLLDLPM